jgi:NADH-quinone oxidoreductase subunit A
MTALVGYLLLFLAVGIGFIFVHLVAGKFLRPAKPEAEKLTIYECGEPTIGSAWIQFDLRFYVIALLFVIFDVEVAFFFPWAVVFGQANTLGNPDAPVEQRAQAYLDLATSDPGDRARAARVQQDLQTGNAEGLGQELNTVGATARQFGWVAFLDIVVFFGVLLVGFAYLWRRGDLAWVRSTAAEAPPSAPPTPAPAPPAGHVLVGAGGQD